MNKFKLTAEEKQIEKDLLSGVYRPVTGKRLEQIKRMLAARKKDQVMTIRVNSDDIRRIKEKAAKLGLRYQTFISEILHEVAVN